MSQILRIKQDEIRRGYTPLELQDRFRPLAELCYSLPFCLEKIENLDCR